MLATSPSRYPRARLNTDDFIGRDHQRKGHPLRLQPEPQVGAVSIDRVGHHPVDGQMGSLGTVHHLQSQFGFRLEADLFGDVSGVPASPILAPVLGQIQFAVDEGVSGGRDARRGRRPLGSFQRAQCIRSTGAQRQLSTCPVWGSRFHR
jgi:hypothetical protein